MKIVLVISKVIIIQIDWVHWRNDCNYNIYTIISKSDKQFKVAVNNSLVIPFSFIDL